MDLDRSVPQDTASRGVCGGRSQRTDVSSFVGGYSSSLPCRALLHRFLGGLSGSHSRRTAQRRRKGNWETAHVERWNNTLRQRLARFVRKTLSFSKSLLMHDVSLRLFLHRYNLERASFLM